MKNLLQLFLFLFVMAIISKFIPGNSMQAIRLKNAKTKNTAAQTTAITNTSQQNPQTTAIPSSYNQNIKTIPDNIIQYLKSSNKYAAYYNQNKKFVIYFTGPGCPYLQSFLSSLDNATKDATIQQQYNFMPIDMNQAPERFNTMEEAQKDVDFNNNYCHEFCIVNPSINKVFAYNGVGEEEAAELPALFNNLKNW